MDKEENMGVNSYTFYDVICRNAGIYSDKEAIVFNNIRLSYREYKEKCDQLAAGLYREGVLKGDRIAVIDQNSEKFLILYGAAAKIGAIIVAVNWRIQQAEMEYIFHDSEPKLVFVGSDYQKMIIDAAEKFSSVKKYYALSQNIPNGFYPIDGLYTSNLACKNADVDAGDGFVIMYTAAVDGQPRGALLSQANIIAVNFEMIDQYSLGKDDCNICFIPLFHIGGLAMCTAIMQSGGRNIIMNRFDAEETVKLIDKEKVTVFFTFAPILKIIADKYEENGGDLSSVQKVTGIESPQNITRFNSLAKNAKFYSAYGQTEAMAVAGGLMDEKPGSVGRPSNLAKIALFDDYDNPAPLGTAGEICVRSPAVFCGYWGLDEANVYTFRNGWHHTGDIGRFDEEGFLWYVKRKAQKDLIKPGGENVYPAEVEKAILAYNSVAEVSVIGVKDDEWGEAVKAIIVLKPGEKIFTLQELTEFMADRIARYKKPKYVTFVDVLPKTADGEIDREKVKMSYGESGTGKLIKL